MKSKDQIFLEQAYSKIVNETNDDNFDYPQHILDTARRLGKHPEEVWRKGGDDYEPPTPKFKERQEGDEFTDNNGKLRIMIRTQDGKLIPAEKVFTSKKDGRQWERFKKSDGKIGVKPFTPKPQQTPKPNQFTTNWGSLDADPNWD